MFFTIYYLTNTVSWYNKTIYYYREKRGYNFLT